MVFFADGKGPLPDSRKEVLFLLAVAVLVVVGSMQYVQANPGAPWQLEAAYSVVYGGDVEQGSTLELSQQDAQYMNRIYREMDGYTETGYCVNLVDDEIRVSKAATLEATSSTIKFTTSNCAVVDGTVHTHPPGSSPVLSGPDTAVKESWNDKRTFLDSGYAVSCVQAGLMVTDVGDRTRSFRCYVKPASGDINDEFPEVPVVITE